MVERLGDGNKVIGIKQVKRALELDEVAIVYIADDADDDFKEDVVGLCNEMRDIQIVYIETMEELGEVCGIDVNAATAALLRKN